MTLIREFWLNGIQSLKVDLAKQLDHDASKIKFAGNKFYLTGHGLEEIARLEMKESYEDGKYVITFIAIRNTIWNSKK